MLRNKSNQVPLIFLEDSKILLLKKDAITYSINGYICMLATIVSKQFGLIKIARTS